MKDGEHIVYYESGEIKYKCLCLDGKLNGEFIYYSISGEIGSKCNYIYGYRNGESIRYHLSGEIVFKYYYIYGKSVTKLEFISYNRDLTLKLLGL